VTQKIKIIHKNLGSRNTGQVHTSKYGTLDLNKKIKARKKQQFETSCIQYMKKLNSDAVPSPEVQFHGQGDGNNVSL
jgi:L-rhamnose isomerase